MADSAPLDDDELDDADNDYSEAFRAWREAEAIQWAGHELDEDGIHDEEECEICLLAQARACKCRCAECCRRLIIEVTLLDAQREPKIAEKGSPLYAPPQLTVSGKRELEGYLLNSAEAGYACVFLDQASNLCTIYETRPLTCRLYDCDGAGREQLIELGILPAPGPKI